ncbi:MAG: 1-acyl-sn-glycerol-3-phosphate acyltransferase [Spirochaetaceae bacterium]|nr:1-acyl-sn-glycerol-3-phosphate acyltransferase [Spirochaetaceae bacterium]
MSAQSVVQQVPDQDMDAAAVSTVMPAANGKSPNISRQVRLRGSFFFSLRRCIVSTLLRWVLGILCKVDCREYVKMLDAIAELADGSPRGIILAINHVNFLEVPILVAFSYPRLVTGIVNADAWTNKFMAFLFDTYAAIPIDRSGSYFQAFRQVQLAMNEGFHMAIAPEGTRSRTGVMARGKAGVVQLALITGAPILPLGHCGGQYFWKNLTHFRRTPFVFNVGRPLRFKFPGRRPTKEEQEIMLDELMGQVAALLPQDMRGVYAEQALRKPEYLESFYNDT